LFWKVKVKIAYRTNRRAQALTVAVAIIGSGLVSMPIASAVNLPSDAAAGCTITAIKPVSVIVGLSPVKTTWSVTTSGCTAPTWTLTSGGKTLATSSAPTRTTDPAKLKNSSAGSTSVTVNVTDHPAAEPAATVTATKAFDLRRRSSWGTTFNGAPEPVDVSKKITITGTLKRADWQANKYTAYANGSVSVQFRASGTTTWKAIKAVKTNSAGKISTTVTAAADGFWRAHFAATVFTGGTDSAADYVEVLTAADKKKFANCTEMNATYPHGVGMTGAVDHVSGSTTPVTDFTRNNNLYTVNSGSDRDKDKIACERL
jgi:Excalibur calcium-binding domain